MRSDIPDRLADLAEDPPETDPDIGDLVARGARRRSRRRFAKVAASGCAAAVVIAAAVAIIPGERGPSVPPIEPLAGDSSSLPGEVAELGPVAPALVYPAAAAQLVTRAENVLIQQCMQAQGWEYPLPYAGIGRNPTDADILASPLTEADAAAHGYGRFWTNPAYAQGGEPVEALNDYLDTLSKSERADWRTALDGNVNDTGDAVDALIIESSSGLGRRLGGCEREAALELLGDQVFDFPEAFGVQFLQFDTDLAQTPLVEAAVERWAACMAEAGHGFDHPAEAVDAGLAERGDSATPVAAEKRIAEDDARCRTESDIATAYDLAFRERNQTVIANNLDQITDWLAVREVAIERATEVILDARPKS